MKKLTGIILLLAASVFLLFAQDQNTAEPETDQQTEVITEKNKLSTLTIEYMPSIDEARFIYSCPSTLFEQGEAMVTIKERATLFTKERGYFFYTYIRKDVIRYDHEKQIATCTSFIKFLN